MRRHVELALGGLLPDGDPGRRGAGAIVRVLLAAERIPPEAADRLRYAVNVANQGVHGREVDPLQAEEAILSAAVGLAFTTPAAGGSGTP